MEFFSEEEKAIIARVQQSSAEELRADPVLRANMATLVSKFDLLISSFQGEADMCAEYLGLVREKNGRFKGQCSSRGSNPWLSRPHTK